MYGCPVSETREAGARLLHAQWANAHCHKLATETPSITIRVFKFMYFLK